MRNRMVIGNWKMNPVDEAAGALAIALQAGVQSLNLTAQMVVAVAPTLLHLQKVKSLCGRHIQIAAQDLSVYAGTGAFTGDISAQLLHNSGVSLVLVGHSERRQYHHEGEALLTKKMQQAFDADLTVVLCVGETLAEREAGNAKTVVLAQVTAQLAAFDIAVLQQKLVIAYEPVWAIGTGLTASPADAQAMHQAIRACLKAHDESLENVSILYGGSVKADNAPALAACTDIDGALVGGAALDATAFISIIYAFAVS